MLGIHRLSNRNSSRQQIVKVNIPNYVIILIDRNENTENINVSLHMQYVIPNITAKEENPNSYYYERKMSSIVSECISDRLNP